MPVRRSGRVALVVLAVVTVSSACSASHHSSPAASTSPTAHGTAAGGLTARATGLDTAMSAATSSIPGQAFTAAVVSSTGSWSDAVGVDGAGTRLVPQDELAVGSITKTFTTAEILHLASQGKLDLDAPTRRYVVSPLTANGATLRDTLSMTSGIRDGRMIENFTTSASTAPDRATSPADLLAYDTTPTAAIGAPGEYSNAGFLLLGQVIERVTGVSYAAAVRRDLLGPAGLDRVRVQSGERPTPPLAYPAATGEKPVTDGWIPDRATSQAAGSAGSIAADAPDIARWGYDLYSARTVVPGADVTAMTTPYGLDRQYGLGTLIFRVGGDDGLSSPAVGHDGEISRFTQGAQYATYNSLMLVVPAEHLSVAVLAPRHTEESALLHVAGLLLRAAGGH